MGVEAGHTYQVSDLWRGVFLSSGNDAVHVLASLNGGWEETAAQMQAQAHKLGALDTEVASPDGYDTPGQVSSAFDLAVFARAGLARPDFATYCSTISAQFPGDEGSYAIVNTNRLLSGNDGVTPYPGIIGVKNGYTSNAGNTLIAAARRGERTLLVTVMNPQAAWRFRGLRGGALTARLGIRGLGPRRRGGLAGIAAALPRPPRGPPGCRPHTWRRSSPSSRWKATTPTGRSRVPWPEASQRPEPLSSWYGAGRSGAAEGGRAR